MGIVYQREGRGGLPAKERVEEGCLPKRGQPIKESVEGGAYQREGRGDCLSKSEMQWVYDFSDISPQKTSIKKIEYRPIKYCHQIEHFYFIVEFKISNLTIWPDIWFAKHVIDVEIYVPVLHIPWEYARKWEFWVLLGISSIVYESREYFERCSAEFQFPSTGYEVSAPYRCRKKRD